MVAFPKYESYQDSGVKWLGKIPSHWRVQPGRAYLKPQRVKNIGNKVITVLSLSYGKIVIKPEEKLHGLVPESFETYQIVEPGNIIVRATDLQNDHTSLRIGLVEDRGIITSAYLCLVPSEKMDSRFTYYLLHTYDLLKVYYGMGSGLRQNLDYTDFKYLRLPIPEIEEQKRIAEFIDCKTSEIDQAIAQKQRIIKLLQEQKAILINQAVTKGLCPNVPTRDSGLEWIGEVPRHWEIKKLKWISPFITVGIVITPSKYYVATGVPCLRSLNIRAGEIIEKELVYISNKSNKYLSKSQIFEGDIVSVRTGQPGTTAVVDRRFHGANCIDLIIVRKSKKISSEYLSIIMNSNVCRSQYFVGSSGAIQQHFNIEMAKNLIICFPPLNEQLQIVDYVSNLDGKMQEMTLAIKREIGSLLELKKVIIASSVTGKIKV